MLLRRKASIDAPIDSDVRSRRTRDRRGLGPLTGGQLTIIIVTLAVLLLVPFGAWAVSGSNVFVTDASSGVHANVSANALTVEPAPPKAVLFRGLALDGTAGTKVLAPPTGHAAVVTTFVVTSSVADLALVAVSTQDATCKHVGSALPLFVANPGLGTTPVPLGAGLVVPAGRALCSASVAHASYGYAYGYLVPAASAPQGALAGVPMSDALANTKAAAVKAHLSVP